MTSMEHTSIERQETKSKVQISSQKMRAKAGDHKQLNKSTHVFLKLRSICCRSAVTITKARAITTAHQNKDQHQNKPMKAQSKNKPPL